MSHEMFLAEDFIGRTKNIYEAIMIIAKRARQIGEEQRREMDAYLSQVEMIEKFEQGEEEGMIEDTPVFHEPVLQFEKPTVLALREMIAEKLTVVLPEGAEKEIPWEQTGGKQRVEEESGVGFPSKLNLLEEDDGGESKD